MESRERKKWPPVWFPGLALACAFGLIVLRDRGPAVLVLVALAYVLHWERKFGDFQEKVEDKLSAILDKLNEQKVAD